LGTLYLGSVVELITLLRGFSDLHSTVAIVVATG
jgi:hypothetical protein